MPNDFNEEDLVIGPITGMRFSSKDVMFDFYKEHARLSGCDRSRKPSNKHVTKKRNCRARINGILEEDGSWRVSKVVKKHNHQLEPALSRLMAGHRSLSKSLKRTLAAKDIAGLRPSKNIRVAEVLAGGPENLGCTPKDCRNYILKSRKLQLQEGDAQSLLKFFSDMQQKDREFYYSVDVDSFGRLCNVVWVHSHSKVAYEEFHDVICLDTTYLVNRYNMSFASFAGVNQHRQSILLGCALMSSKDITSYKMVLSTWLGALNNVHPLAIMTDQSYSIKAAINALMPNTIAKAEFKALVLDSINVAEFERRWTEYIEKYNLDGRDWFYKLYLEKEKWVPLRKLYHCEISTPEDHQAIAGMENYIIADYFVQEP
ncbi:PREDICTED: protein FAR-RED IMPAIRED RESPONSE 1-like [Nicotiana attenuata]|uniref:protein FAR-RED IMPAIRED RESPONSE 1-like n=1 Tax=Nicotiana attenuata TaxID=49451 RepID=UPI000905AB9E|nr:PREDICTED: protein FAR-RED IMPAIRED RESPONSE 1-like [Nicotiana attenuata]